MQFNFNKHSTNRINSFDVPYDYASIMHYGAYAFSKNRRATIISRKAGERFGQRAGLSPLDKKQLRLLYGCSVGSTKKPVPTTTSGIS